MKFKNWKIWFSKLPVSLKWFVVLVLVRPFVDLFYFLKEISPIISPLYIVGIGTPILIFFSFLSRKFPKRFKSFTIDISYGSWAILVLFNLIILLLSEGVGVMSEFIRYSTPVFLFFYIRHFIRSKVDLIGLLQTFCYSAYIPLVLLIYELLFGAINPEYLSESRGGEARLQGGYADIMNYAIYFTMTFLIQCYFFIRSSKLKALNRRKRFRLIATFVICVVGLIGIKQSSSWAVILFVSSLFMLYNLRSKRGALLVIISLPIVLFVTPIIFESSIEPLIEKEYKVLEGDAKVERLFNGRMSRWIIFFDIWSDMPLVSNIVGVPTSGDDRTLMMISGAMHNDYVRVIFLTGILGLFFYLMFLFNLLIRARKIPIPERFLIFGTVGTILLYSISTNPLLYFPLLYCVYPIMAYAALPKMIQKKHG